ncbi:hypothetical protein [Streptomyces sp. NPDC008150]|uniref:hypothetical protein n=1 Tax=Streptomyces sp. NPDC008150 TaxID=3364816 RepID=UPI0036E1F16A
MTDPTDDRLTADIRAADRLVAEGRRAVHEALVLLPAWEADRVRSLVADLETAIEGRTAMRTGLRSAVLTEAERQFLKFALDLAADLMASRGDKFEEDDQTALDSLRRLASEEQPVPVDRAALRDRIADALLTTRRTDYADLDVKANHRQHRYDARCALCAYDVDALADAVLAVLGTNTAVPSDAAMSGVLSALPGAAGMAQAAQQAEAEQPETTADGQRAALSRVRALHQQYAFGADAQDYCAHCNQITGGWVPWPCPTMQTLEAVVPSAPAEEA